MLVRRIFRRTPTGRYSVLLSDGKWKPVPKHYVVHCLRQTRYEVTFVEQVGIPEELKEES